MFNDLVVYFTDLPPIIYFCRYNLFFKWKARFKYPWEMLSLKSWAKL